MSDLMFTYPIGSLLRGVKLRIMTSNCTSSLCLPEKPWQQVQTKRGHGFRLRFPEVDLEANL